MSAVNGVPKLERTRSGLLTSVKTTEGKTSSNSLKGRVTRQQSLRLIGSSEPTPIRGGVPRPSTPVPHLSSPPIERKEKPRLSLAERAALPAPQARPGYACTTSADKSRRNATAKSPKSPKGPSPFSFSKPPLQRPSTYSGRTEKPHLPLPAFTEQDFSPPPVITPKTVAESRNKTPREDGKGKKPLSIITEPVSDSKTPRSDGKSGDSPHLSPAVFEDKSSPLYSPRDLQPDVTGILDTAGVSPLPFARERETEMTPISSPAHNLSPPFDLPKAPSPTLSTPAPTISIPLNGSLIPHIPSPPPPALPVTPHRERPASDTNLGVPQRKKSSPSVSFGPNTPTTPKSGTPTPRSILKKTQEQLLADYGGIDLKSDPETPRPQSTTPRKKEEREQKFPETTTPRERKNSFDKGLIKDLERWPKSIRSLMQEALIAGRDQTALSNPFMDLPDLSGTQTVERHIHLNVISGDTLNGEGLNELFPNRSGLARPQRQVSLDDETYLPIHPIYADPTDIQNYHFSQEDIEKVSRLSFQNTDISDGQLTAIARRFSHVKHLSLDINPDLTDDALRAIDSLKLRTLQIRFCPGLTEIGIHRLLQELDMSELTALSLSTKVPINSPDTFGKLVAAPLLEKVDLSFSEGLTPEALLCFKEVPGNRSFLVKLKECPLITEQTIESLNEGRKEPFTVTRGDADE